MRQFATNGLHIDSLRIGGYAARCKIYREQDMGQAKQRGSQAERVAQAQAKIEATRPEKLICNSCKAELSELHPVSTRGLRGLQAIWVGQCSCGQPTFSAVGEPQAVEAFFTALSAGSDLALGSQNADGSEHEIA